MNSYHYGRRDYNQSHEDNAPLVIVILITLVFVLGAYLLTTRFHVRPYQLVEISIYFLSLLASIVATTWYLLTQKARRENTWPHAPVYIPLLKDEDQVRKAFHQKCGGPGIQRASPAVALE